MFTYLVGWLSQFSGVCLTKHAEDAVYKKCTKCDTEYCVVCVSFILAGYQIYADLGVCRNCIKK